MVDRGGFCVDVPAKTTTLINTIWEGIRMKKEAKFFICRHCGNIAFKVEDSGVKMVCCGDQMEELVANTTDAATEKHVPVYTVNGNTVEVQVGSVPHPMLDEHHIGWVCLHSQEKTQFQWLTPGEEPKAEFVLTVGDKPVTVYEWCNLHGLWKADF